MHLQWKLRRKDGTTIWLGSPSTALDRKEMRDHLSHELETHNWGWAPGDTVELVAMP